MPRFPPARPAFSYFHALWLSGAVAGAILGLGLPHRSVALWIRILAAAGGAIAGFAVAGIVVAVLVMWVVIPRLTPGSIWSYEVNCYMLSILGEKWRDAGKHVPPN
jgi:uncharacterized membrane protein